MIPLILLALGLGAALTVYELSPRTRARVDDYARAIRAASAAHRAADAHLSNADAATATAVRHAQQADSAARQAAQPAPVPWPAPTPPAPMPPAPVPTPTPMPPPDLAAPTPTPTPMPPPDLAAPTPTPPAPMPEPAPAPLSPAPPAPPPAQDIAVAHANAAQAAADAAVDHAAAATEANQVAAQNTADAAKNAQAEAERQAAAESAAKVLEREKKIAQALASLGVGQCGVRSYPRVTPRVKDTLIARLRAEGMAVTGDNPWNIDTRTHGVKLRAVWDPRAQSLKLIVTAGKGELAYGIFRVTCEEIWKKIEPKMKEAIAS